MNLRFEPVPRQDFEDFKKDVKDIFAIAVIKHFGMPEDGEVVPDADVDESLYNPKAEVFYVYLDDKRVGGVVLTIDRESHRNKMDLFYIYPDCHSKGIGHAIWKRIEGMYPETRVWELVTPLRYGNGSRACIPKRESGNWSRLVLKRGTYIFM